MALKSSAFFLLHTNVILYTESFCERFLCYHDYLAKTPNHLYNTYYLPIQSYLEWTRKYMRQVTTT